jgi:hypothetical protein
MRAIVGLVALVVGGLAVAAMAVHPLSGGNEAAALVGAGLLVWGGAVLLTERRARARPYDIEKDGGL